jgi:hypothetical protein
MQCIIIYHLKSDMLHATRLLLHSSSLWPSLYLLLLTKIVIIVLFKIKMPPTGRPACALKIIIILCRSCVIVMQKKYCVVMLHFHFLVYVAFDGRSRVRKQRIAVRGTVRRRPFIDRAHTNRRFECIGVTSAPVSFVPSQAAFSFCLIFGFRSLTTIHLRTHASSHINRETLVSGSQKHQNMMPFFAHRRQLTS